jgi:hypothetical protein
MIITPANLPFRACAAIAAQVFFRLTDTAPEF